MSVMKEPYLKTINGENLNGDGNIQITGLPDPAYAQEGDILQLKSGVWTPVKPLGDVVYVNFEITAVDETQVGIASMSFEEIYLAFLSGKAVKGIVETPYNRVLFNLSSIYLSQDEETKNCCFTSVMYDNGFSAFALTYDSAEDYYTFNSTEV